MSDGESGRRVAVLFSGGTDSTAAAALLAQRFTEVHLLTYARLGFHGAGHSALNAGRLTARFPDRRFVHRVLETSALGRWVATHRQWHYLWHHGFMTLQACGHCALANHLATLAYCLRAGITDLADGITHDWPFFPGHMDRVIDELRAFHAGFGIDYHTPVLEFDVDRPVRYIDKVHEREAARRPATGARTTGRLLHELGLSEVENYKGTETDRKAQARCFQFVLPNLYVHWVFRGPERWDEYEARVLAYFRELLADSRQLVEAHRTRAAHADLFRFLDGLDGG